MKEIIITKNEANQRIDRFFKKFFPKASTGFIYKMLRKKRIKLNNKRAKPKMRLEEGDKLQLYIAEKTINKFKKDITIDNKYEDIKVLYEDDNIVLIQKDIGVLCHPAQHNKTNTLSDQLLYYLYKKEEYDPKNEKTFKPSLCNRLDRNTGGIIIGAKNYNSLKVINEAIRKRQIEKYYKCLVKGRINDDFELKGFLVKNEKENKVKVLNKKVDGAKKIHTKVNVIKRTKNYSLLEVNLITGRTHQIRVHLSSNGNPIIGDYKYGDKKQNNIFKNKFGLKSQFLYSYKIIFKGLKGSLSYLNGKIFESKLEEKLAHIESQLF